MNAWDTDAYREHERVLRQQLRDAHPDVPRLGISVRAGWLPLVGRFLTEAKAARPEGVAFEYVVAKAKWGLVQFSYRLDGTGSLELLRRIAEIEEAVEDVSVRTCEVCGEPGRLRSFGDGMWLVTRCDEHADGSEPFYGGGDDGGLPGGKNPAGGDENLPFGKKFPPLVRPELLESFPTTYIPETEPFDEDMPWLPVFGGRDAEDDG